MSQPMMWLAFIVPHLDKPSILEKVINRKKLTQNEIAECVNCFNLIYVDEFPIAFFYRLIIYLNEKKDQETLKTVFKRLDEESIKWTEVWPRSAEVLRIREEVA